MRRSVSRPRFPVLFVLLLLVLLTSSVWPAGAQAPAAWLVPYKADASRLIEAGLADDFAWQRLAELTDLHGARPAGSENLSRAIAWAVEAMKADGLENVHVEPVMVSRWVRGEERAMLTTPVQSPLAILGLGGTVATPSEGIEADVLPITSFDELRAKGADVAGRIVLFDVPYSTYAETVAYRTDGASAAARYGAVAVLVRSIGPIGLRTPHTGSVEYAPDVTAIPAASISVEDANRLVRLAGRGRQVRVRLVTSGHVEPDVESANVVGEIRGRETPEEIVLVGGHLDSWDVGTGASDDGAGCIVTWEAARLMTQLGLRPRRTVRVVLWTDEEHGLRGADAYARRYAGAAADHVFALEADSGVFAPSAFGFSGSAAAWRTMWQIGSLLAPLGLSDIRPGGGGADIAPIAKAGRTPMMAYLGDPARLFVIHHTEADTVERIAPDEMGRAAAAIAVVAYVVADMPDRLAR